MILVDLLIALAVASFLAAVVFLLLRTTGPWASFPLLFLALFLATWAGGIWLAPIGRPVGGVYWVPFLMAGIVFALLLAAVVPPERPEEQETTIELLTEAEKKARERTNRLAVGLLFWLFAGVLAIAILLRYVGS
jgi:hypothetical protein